MRKKNKIITILCMFVCVAVFVACSDDNDGGTVTPDISGYTEPALSDIKVINSGTRSWHDHYAMMLNEAESGANGEDEELADFAREQLRQVDSIDNARKEDMGANGDVGEANYSPIGYKYYTISYPSVDNNSQPVNLTELLVMPDGKVAQNIIIGCHVTITSDKECPSNYANGSLLTDVGMLACHAGVHGPRTSISYPKSYENLVILPDYQGYGATKDRVHPYLYQTVTARQVVDGAIAGKKYYEAYLGKLDPDYKSISVGYSQGGSVSMAVHRYIEQNKLDDATHLNYAGSVCGDGPYDPVATLRDYVRTDSVFMPVATALIIKGMCDTNPYVAGKYTPSDYFTSSFLNSGIMNWIADKEYTTSDIQKRLADYSAEDHGFTMMRKSYKLLPISTQYRPYTAANKKKYSWVDATSSEAVFCRVDQILRPEVIKYIKDNEADDADKPKLQAIVNALEMNNLCKDWTPRHPMVVFHSRRDEVVPYVNYSSASAAFGDPYFKGFTYNSSMVYTHTGTGSSFYMLYEVYYTEKIFDGRWAEYAHDGREGNWF